MIAHYLTRLVNLRVPWAMTTKEVCLNVPRYLCLLQYPSPNALPCLVLVVQLTAQGYCRWHGNAADTPEMTHLRSQNGIIIATTPFKITSSNV